MKSVVKLVARRTPALTVIDYGLKPTLCKKFSILKFSPVSHSLQLDLAHTNDINHDITPS